MKANLKTKFHRDGSVTLWNVYRQQWVRMDAAYVTAETLATLTDAERNRIRHMVAADLLQLQSGGPLSRNVRIRHMVAADLLLAFRTHRHDWVRMWGSDLTVKSLGKLTDDGMTSIRRMLDMLANA